jgi:hypothetical protein
LFHWSLPSYNAASNGRKTAQQVETSGVADFTFIKKPSKNNLPKNTLYMKTQSLTVTMEPSTSNETVLFVSSYVSSASYSVLHLPHSAVSLNQLAQVILFPDKSQT